MQFDCPGHFLEGIDDQLELQAAKAQEAFAKLECKVQKGLYGLKDLIGKLILAIITGEHALIEGPPGVAKTRVAQKIAGLLGLTFKRIQFSPDLMPSDLIHRERLEFEVSRQPSIRWLPGSLASGGQWFPSEVSRQPSIRWLPGPIFTNILLADEINRASPRVQAALLEASEERQVTTLFQGRMVVRPQDPDPSEFNESAALSESPAYFGLAPIDPKSKRGQQFTMLATMNPIEQEGVYPLSEAQLDRFAFKLIVGYPELESLEQICSEVFEVQQGHSACHSKSDHVKCLYFLTALREKLFGESAMKRWMADERTGSVQENLFELRSRICKLIYFTCPLRGEDGKLTPAGQELEEYLIGPQKFSPVAAAQEIQKLPRA